MKLSTILVQFGIITLGALVNVLCLRTFGDSFLVGWIAGYCYALLTIGVIYFVRRGLI